MQRLTGRIICFGAGGARWWPFSPGLWRFLPRRLTISSLSASFRFRCWSGFSTARPPKCPTVCSAICGRLSPSAGGSASAISLPACGGSAAPSRRGRQFRLGAAVRGHRHAGPAGLLLRFRHCARPSALDRRYRPIAALAFGFGAGGVAARLPVHRLSVECRRLCGDAGTLVDAERVGGRHDRHERARCLRFRDAGSAFGRRHVRLGAAWLRCSGCCMPASATIRLPHPARAAGNSTSASCNLRRPDAEMGRSMQDRIFATMMGLSAPRPPPPATTSRN